MRALCRFLKRRGIWYLRFLPRALVDGIMWGTQAKFLLAVVVVVFHRGQVLLVRHRYRPRYPWGLVTGFVERGETLENASVREITEEAGIAVVAGSLRFLGSSVVSGHHLETVFWAVAETDKTAGASADGEIQEAAWFSVGALPEGLWPPQRRLIQWADQTRRLRADRFEVDRGRDV